MTKERNNNPLGIYIHVPFCLKKCNYCDFFSHAVKDESEVENYFASLCDEIRNSEHRGRFCDTVFFGGGTPSLPDPVYIENVLAALRDGFIISDDAEISIEANPETFSKEKLFYYKKLGINRISIGIQSLNDDVLKRMGRVHNADRAREAIRLVKELGLNYNCDLIFGAPGQTIDIFKRDFDEILSFEPNHVSFYSLQIEECTPFYIDYRFGNLQIPSWEENRSMYHYAVNALKSRGYHHYEVSNAAKPGFECRHNLKYWTMQEYVGFGKSAHSFIGGHRTDDQYPDLKTDFIFTELRLIDGFDKNDYLKMFGSNFEDDFKISYNKLINEGLLKVNGSTIAFTEKGLDQTNLVLEQLINEKYNNDEGEQL